MRICFFGRVAEALKGITPGGAELQMSLLARALAGEGITIDIIDTTVLGSFNTDERIKVWGVPGWFDGVKGLRFFTHRIPNVVSLLLQHPADVYYVRGLSFWYLVVLILSKYHKATFVLATAHDSDLMGFNDRYRLFYRYDKRVWEWVSNYLPTEIISTTLRRSADILLVQHNGQKRLAEALGIRAFVFKNIFSCESNNIKSQDGRKNFVFVGALNVRKGLPNLIKIVEGCANDLFEIIGPPTDVEGRRAYEVMKALKNTIVMGMVNNDKTREFIGSAKALINTSPMEGFPNAFLEAWSMGTPVLSLRVDPDGVIEEHNLGHVFGDDVEKMKKYITNGKISFDPAALRGYVEQFHSFVDAAKEFQKILALEDNRCYLP